MPLPHVDSTQVHWLYLSRDADTQAPFSRVSWDEESTGGCWDGTAKVFHVHGAAKQQSFPSLFLSLYNDE